MQEDGALIIDKKKGERLTFLFRFFNSKGEVLKTDLQYLSRSICVFESKSKETKDALIIIGIKYIFCRENQNAEQDVTLALIINRPATGLATNQFKIPFLPPILTGCTEGHFGMAFLPYLYRKLLV